MFDRFDAYANHRNDQFNFTRYEWAGLVIAGNIAAAISFLSNSFVLFLHGFMLWYKPVIVNRLSLRMIVLSCIFNMIYCACQLVSDDISSTSFTCRALAFVLISSDTMACMCLAMVGLNLVTIFVFKFSRSIKLEIFYYCLIVLSGVLVVIMPILVGPERGPKKREVAISCWYHFFFDGRMTNLFNWMWYYGWILFSLAFAALCAAISIRFVLKKQDNFAGTLDMFTRRSRVEMSQINTLKIYANNNTDIFTKIARRCICYPLVPLISKSWGVGIEIAAIKGVYIPYEIFILDRVFSCLLGLMVSCIYFTDPAIGAVLQDFKSGVKKKYVFDYYTVRFQPGRDPTIQRKSQYPQLVSIIPLSSNATPDESFRVRSNYFGSQSARDNVSTSAGDTFISPLDMSHLHPHIGHVPMPYKPEIPTMEVHKAHEEPFQDRRYSVVSVTSMTGKIFLPNEVIQENHFPSDGYNCCKRSNISTIPMRRVNDVKKTPFDAHRHRRAYSKSTETVEMLVPYKFPRAAKFLHWILTSVFRVKQTERRNSTDSIPPPPVPQSSRVFYDYTDSSHPGTPTRPDMALASPSQLDEPVSPRSRSRHIRSGSDGSITLSKLKSRNVDDEEDIKEHPIRKVSSINVASLYRSRLKNKHLDLSNPASDESFDRSPSSSSSNSRFASSLGLTRILSRGRSMSFSWSRLTRPTKKSGLSSPVGSTTAISSKGIELKEVASGLKIKRTTTRESKAESSSDPGKAVILAPFSGELSPRPAIQYRKRILERRFGKPAPRPALIRKTRTHSQIERDVESETSTSTNSDNVLYGLSLLFDNVNNEFEFKEEDISLTADDILQPLSVTFTPTDEIREMETPVINEELKNTSIKRKIIGPLKDAHEGFMEGTTTLDYISNWEEEADRGESSRITVYSEPWDIEDQYKEQAEFEDEISHI